MSGGSSRRYPPELRERKVAPDGVTVTMFEGLGDLPFYNEDIDTATEVPAAPAVVA